MVLHRALFAKMNRPSFPMAIRPDGETFFQRLKQVDRNDLGIVIASKAPCNGEAITQNMARLLLHDAFVGKPPRNDDGRWCLSRCYSVFFQDSFFCWKHEEGILGFFSESPSDLPALAGKPWIVAKSPEGEKKNDVRMKEEERRDSESGGNRI